MLKPALVLDVILLCIVIWSAHLAGASYVVAKTDPSYRMRGIARTGIAIVAAVAIIIRVNIGLCR